jgi:hypothetical protein
MTRQLDALTTMKEQTTDPIAPTSIVDTSRYPGWLGDSFRRLAAPAVHS